MCFYQQFHSFNSTFFFNTITPPPTPESMLSKVKERLKGLKYSIGFGGRRWGNTGEEDRYMFTLEKTVILQKCLNTFVPHCSSPSLWKEGGKHAKAKMSVQILHTACPTKIYMLIQQLNPTAHRAESGSYKGRRRFKSDKKLLNKFIATSF